MTRRPISAPRSRRFMSCCSPPMRLIWIWALIALADRPTLLGTAFLAYVLGLRHAVDADHIASIDNVVRKLMQEGKRPFSVGLFFSLGHSLAITLAVAGIAAAAFALAGRFAELKAIGSIIGTGASAFFLLAIAVINLVILRGVWRSFRRARRGEPVAEQELNMLLVRPRLSRPHLSSAVPHGVAQLADVSGRLSVRAGLRYRDRDQPVHRRREPGLRRHDVRHGHDFPGSVHRRHDARRHHRQRADGRRLRLGVPQSDPQDLVQSHHHGDFRRRRAADRRHRGARADRRQARPRRRVLERGRRSQRRPRQFRLSGRRHFRRQLGGLVSASIAGRASTGRSPSAPRWQSGERTR